MFLKIIFIPITSVDCLLLILAGSQTYPFLLSELKATLFFFFFSRKKYNVVYLNEVGYLDKTGHAFSFFIWQV